MTSASGKGRGRGQANTSRGDKLWRCGCHHLAGAHTHTHCVDYIALGWCRWLWLLNAKTISVLREGKDDWASSGQGWRHCACPRALSTSVLARGISYLSAHLPSLSLPGLALPNNFYKCLTSNCALWPNRLRAKVTHNGGQCLAHNTLQLYSVSLIHQTICQVSSILRNKFLKNVFKVQHTYQDDVMKNMKNIPLVHSLQVETQRHTHDTLWSMLSTFAML